MLHNSVKNCSAGTVNMMMIIIIRGGDMAKIPYFFGKSRFHYFITILFHVSFTILSEQCSQNNFNIIKTNPFKVTTYTKIMLDK